MLAEELAELAAAGGMAVAQAAGTDAWNGLRTRVGMWFGCEDVVREQAALARLDQTEMGLAGVAPDQARMYRGEQAAAWRVRFADLLAELDGDARDQAVAELHDLVAQFRSAATGGVTADVVIRGDVQIQPMHGSVGAVKMGDITMGNPRLPDAEAS